MSRFGADVHGQLQAWFASAFMEEFHTKYGDEAGLAVIVLDHQGTPLHELITHPDEQDIVQRLFENIHHKLNFVKRTGLPSQEATRRPDLVEPGDFAAGGAGIHRGYMGGASGLEEESDWWCYCRVVDKLIELRAAAALPALQASRDRVEGWKFLDGQISLLAGPDAAKTREDMHQRG